MGQGVVVPPFAHERRDRQGLWAAEYRYATCTPWRDGGFRDPRFATFKMASDKGCHIIKGSHGYPIERWKRMLVSKTDPTVRLKQPKTEEEWKIALANPEYKEEPRCVGTFTVFNAEQMENAENLISVECFSLSSPTVLPMVLSRRHPAPLSRP